MNSQHVNWQKYICDQCGANVKFVSTVLVRAVRKRIEGELAVVQIRACRNCVERSLLLPRPTGDIVTDPTRWRWLWLNKDLVNKRAP
jgi:hypothetical protein